MDHAHSLRFLRRECAGGSLAPLASGRPQGLSNIVSEEVVAGKGDVGENGNCLVIWLVTNPISHEAVGEIDERADFAQPCVPLRTVLSTDTKG
jgi:hypothetical protein